jgi:hypothetical protein
MSWRSASYDPMRSDADSLARRLRRNNLGAFPETRLYCHSLPHDLASTKSWIDFFFILFLHLSTSIPVILVSCHKEERCDIRNVQ